ncbi:MAG TPA: SagB/ThcOx family dehydrogenase [Acidobacteriota bacterium]|nr:SagB/ThcOx family dehydrogenase [Acidobacteriota bacterium]
MSDAARRYHRISTHKRDKLIGAGSLDWANEPGRAKEYPGAPEVHLPEPEPFGVGLADVFSGKVMARAGAPGMVELAALLRLGYGVTSRKGGNDFRAAPSAGALFPAEVYLCCGETEGLDAGLYYFNPMFGRVVQVAAGDFRRSLAGAAPGGGAHAAYLIITAIPWRSSWKYRARAYRYCLLDSGHVAGNLLLIGSALGLQPRLITQLDEGPINAILGIDGTNEFPMAVIGLSNGGNGFPDPPADFTPRTAEPLSPRMAVDEDILAIHRAECCDVKRGLPALRPSAPEGGEAIPMRSAKAVEGSLEVLQTRRRSFRGGAKAPLALDDLSAYLAAVTWAYPADWMPAGWKTNLLPDLTLVALGAEGLGEGIYRYDAEHRSLLKSDAPFERDDLTVACMGQRFIAKANAFLVISLDFARLEAPGAYRIAGLDAGIVGQFAYLAAEALGAGCCGIGAFFEDELSRLIGYDGSDRIALYGLTFAKRKRFQI